MLQQLQEAYCWSGCTKESLQESGPRACLDFQPQIQQVCIGACLLRGIADPSMQGDQSDCCALSRSYTLPAPSMRQSSCLLLSANFALQHSPCWTWVFDNECAYCWVRKAKAAHLADALAAAAPGGLKHDGVPDVGAALQGLLQAVHARLLVQLILRIKEVATWLQAQA